MSVPTFIFIITLLTGIALGMCFSIRNVTVPQSGNLDSPQWFPQDNALYFVNQLQQMMFRIDGKTGAITNMSLSYGQASFIVPVKDNPGFLVVAVRTSVYILKWGAPGGDNALRQLNTVDQGKPDNDMGDGKADAAGRLWFGTLGKLNLSLPTLGPTDQATLYSMDSCNFADPAIKKRPVSVSNGIAFSLDNKKMYYNDSPTRTVVAFDYDLQTGFIANESVVFDFKEFSIPGFPDGMTIDADGNLWVATFTNLLIHINPRKKELMEWIELPVDQVTSATWGDNSLTSLFVTTANLNVSNPKPLSGSVLIITGLGTRGVPENQFVFPNAATY